MFGATPSMSFFQAVNPLKKDIAKLLLKEIKSKFINHEYRQMIFAPKLIIF